MPPRNPTHQHICSSAPAVESQGTNSHCWSLSSRFRPCPSHLRGWEAPPLNPGSKQNFLPCDGWAQGTIISLSCLSFSVSVSPSLLSSRVWVLTCLRGWTFEGQSIHALRGVGEHSVALPLGRFICLQSPECSPARSEEQPRVSTCVNK